MSAQLAGLMEATLLALEAHTPEEVRALVEHVIKVDSAVEREVAEMSGALAEPAIIIQFPQAHRQQA